MWVVTRHQHEISTLVPQTLFRVVEVVGATIVFPFERPFFLTTTSSKRLLRRLYIGATCTQTLFYFSFRCFRKHRRARRARKKNEERL